MIILTGAAGFIGSCLLRKLNDEGLSDIVLVDDFSRTDKSPNLDGKQFHSKIDRKDFPNWFQTHSAAVSFVFHLGARTDTAAHNPIIFNELNLDFSKTVWQICAVNQIPLVYASSAATYGAGEHGYDDRHDIVPQLQPLNPYGRSKNDFDIWALQQTGELANHLPTTDGQQSPPFWAGLKFFNVYGPNEYHKGRMASVIFHTVKQIQATGSMKLFRSHHPDYRDGGQLRDFIYVKDITEVGWFFYNNQKISGLYNVGTGTARPFWDLAVATFHAMNLTPNITFVDIPADIRDTYQYFTKANMQKLRAAGYNEPFHSLEEGVEDYVRNYLPAEKIW